MRWERFRRLAGSSSGRGEGEREVGLEGSREGKRGEGGSGRMTSTEGGAPVWNQSEARRLLGLDGRRSAGRSLQKLAAFIFVGDRGRQGASTKEWKKADWKKGARRPLNPLEIPLAVKSTVCVLST